MRKKRDAAAESGATGEPEVPKKLYEIAKLLRNKLPEKTTSLLGHKVKYFIGRKAVDVLMDSKLKETLEIGSRSQACYLMEEMLGHKFFHRAQKIALEVKPRKPKDQENDDDTEANGTPRATPRTERGRKKFKLDMHQQQVFLDAVEPYVWIYDPIPLRTWLLGTLLVMAAIAVCMFPLWPRRMRDGVYYLSMAAAGFLGLILALAVIRQIVFVAIFLVSLGKHRLWILPNLTEDCGFFESFLPLYSYEYCGEITDTPTDAKPSEKKKSSSSKDNKQRENKDVKSAASSISSTSSVGNLSSKDQAGSKSGSEDSEFEILDAGHAESRKEQ